MCYGSQCMVHAKSVIPGSRDRWHTPVPIRALKLTTQRVFSNGIGESGLRKVGKYYSQARPCASKSQQRFVEDSREDETHL